MIPIGHPLPPVLFPLGPAPLDARYPIAMFPVRLETRFDGALLKVRIFPDEIFADTHEPGLTDDERRDGAAYVATIGGAGEAEAWRLLVARYTAPRAAWIALASAKGAPETRAASWSRAAQAIMPDSWLVRAYRGANVYTATIPAVKQPLALTLSPNPANVVAVDSGLSIDAELAWTLDFGAALEVGMAVTIDLTKPDQLTPGTAVDASGGVDLVVVVGLKQSFTPQAGADHLHALIDAHHYTRGVAFVAPGTPSSNSADGPAHYPPADAGGTESFADERAKPLVTPAQKTSDGVLLASALGLTPAAGEQVAAVEHLHGAAATHDDAAQAMNATLWPATLGYFMQQMMAPKFDDATIESARRYFLANVRPGGPLPTIRVGRVPYGILPVTSLTRFAPDGPLPRALRVLRDNHFVAATAKVPRVTPGSADPDGDLLKALAVDASCRRVRIRAMLGQDVTTNTAGLLGGAGPGTLQVLMQTRAGRAQAILASVGLGADTRLGHVDPGASADLLGAPLVTRGPLSETEGVPYIQWLHDRAAANDLDSLRNDKLPGTDRPLLYRVLRHALLLEMDRIAVPKLVATHVIQAAERREVELVGLQAQAQLTTYDRIDRALLLPGFGVDLGPYLQQLAALATLPSAELDRRFGETLDACAHRLDAWITSLATSRLWAMRASAPTGCHFGAFGWVENVRPAAGPRFAAGYIHAPSPAHASAAAILRNGHVSRGGAGTPYAVDLSSARVREALRLLDGARQGEPLGALLGYRFERALHDHQIEPCIAPLRDAFPQVAGKTPEGAGPTELVAAGNVVDGLALSKKSVDELVALPGMPALSPAQRTSLQGALDAMVDAVDGVADLLTAESVFQAVRGNPSASAASLDAMAQGTLPPDPAVVRSPTGGGAFTQRLAVVLDGHTQPPPHATPRALAEPALDAWAATLLGSFAQIGCRVALADGTTRGVTLDRLGLRPLDVIALAKTPASGAGDGELDRRVLDAAAAPAGARVHYDASDVAHSFAETFELARVLGQLVAKARPLLPADLVPAVASAPIADAVAQQAAGRAHDVLGQLASTSSALSTSLATVSARIAGGTQPSATELADLRNRLQAAAAFGVAGAYPARDASAADLVATAAGVQKELAARLPAGALTGADAAALLAAATAAMQAVFGREFLFLPQLAPSSLAPAALAESAALVGDPHLPRQVLQQMARVRDGLDRWRSLWIYAGALGAAAPAIEVAQLPTGQPTWAARPGASPTPGTLSLLLHRATRTAADRPWAGFVVDEWNEVIPSATQPTSIAFHHETPIAEAPQTILLAVPPASGNWDIEAVVDTVRETLTLAKLRLVDSTLLDELQPFLPAICLTGNTANESISTDFRGWLVAEPAILRNV